MNTSPARPRSALLLPCVHLWWLLLATSLPACDAKKPDAVAAPAPSQTSQAPTAAATTSVEPAAAAGTASAAPITKGLAASGNHPEVVAMFKGVLATCKWTGDGFDLSCPGAAEWYRWISEPSRPDVHDTLVAILGDDDRRVRYLAALGLEIGGSSPEADPKRAAALFDALDRDSAPTICFGIARAAGWVDTGKVGLETRARALAKTYRTPKCRAEFVQKLLGVNPQFYDLVVELAKGDADTTVRVAAVNGLASVFTKDVEHQRRNCKVWIELADDPDPAVAQSAVFRIVEEGFGHCNPEKDELVEKTLTDAGKVQWRMGGRVCRIYQYRRTEQQRAKLLVLARKIAEDMANEDADRAAALDCIGMHDPEAKAFAGKLANDPGPKVKASAAKIVGAPSSDAGLP